jgi:ribosomal protein L7/L12
MSAGTNGQMPLEAIAQLREGNKIEAIKIVRKAHGTQLKEAKDMVEAYLATQPALQKELSARQAEAKGTLIKWLLIVGGLLALAYFLAGAP